MKDFINGYRKHWIIYSTGFGFLWDLFFYQVHNFVGTMAVVTVSAGVVLLIARAFVGTDKPVDDWRSLTPEKTMRGVKSSETLHQANKQPSVGINDPNSYLNDPYYDPTFSASPFNINYHANDDD